MENEKLSNFKLFSILIINFCIAMLILSFSYRIGMYKQKSEFNLFTIILKFVAIIFFNEVLEYVSHRAMVF